MLRLVRQSLYKTQALLHLWFTQTDASVIKDIWALVFNPVPNTYTVRLLHLLKRTVS
jgi:hypothetical protein